MEMEQPNMVSISEDEGTAQMVAIDQSFLESVRFYDKQEVQEILDSD
jgi:hypothetical protein